MILSAVTKAAPDQAARPVPLYHGYIKFLGCCFVVLVFLIESSSQFQWAVQKIWSFSHQAPVHHLLYSAAPLILPPQWDPDAAGSWKAILSSACVESNQGWQKQKIQQPRSRGQEKSALHSNAVSAGIFCTAGAMPQQL